MLKGGGYFLPGSTVVDSHTECLVRKKSGIDARCWQGWAVVKFAYGYRLAFTFLGIGFQEIARLNQTGKIFKYPGTGKI